MPPRTVKSPRPSSDSVAPTLLAAGTLLTQLQALPSVGVDATQVAAAVQAVVGELPQAPDALVPVAAYNEMWRAAQALYGLPGLPTALALAIPFGAFGTIDYLAGSAGTVAGSIDSLVLHMAVVSRDTQLEQRAGANGDQVVKVSVAGGGNPVAEEFALAMLASRLRYLTDGRVLPRRLALTAPAPPKQHTALRERMLGVPVQCAQPVSCLVIAAADWSEPLRSADPYLHATMQRMATQLHVAGSAQTSDLEQAIRARLRDALAADNADPGRMARLLGLSERTLQRRLADIGRSFSAVVEDFRREEAALLLADARYAVVEVAARLGYAEQTSFTRAFRRWTGTTPAAWRRGQAAG